VESVPVNSIEEETLAGFLSHVADTRLEPYVLPWGKRIWLRVLTVCEVEQWRNNLARVRDPETKAVEVNDPYASAKFCVLAVCKADGSRLFAPDQYMQLAAMLNDVITPLTRAAMRFSAVADEVIEDLVKNSRRTQTSASGSASQPGTAAPSTTSGG
jgi:hypothetical protein